MIDQSYIDQFARDGFVVVPGVFSREEIASFAEAVDQAIAEREDKLPGMAERDQYDRMFTQYYNLWESSPLVRRWTFAPRLAEIASRLLQAPALRLYCDQSFYKEPGSSGTGVHQDYRLLSIEETQTLNAWIPFEGCTRDAGALAYLPGSHKFGPVTNLDLALGRDPLADVRRLIDNPVFLELEPGSVAFHHVLTYHLSSPNQSSRTRKAMAITYFADGSTRGTTWPHASVDRDSIAVGEPIQSLATPIVWPAPQRLPPAPPPNPNAPKGWPGYKRQD